MNLEYCKLLDGNKIYEVKKINGDKITLRNANSTIVTEVSNVTFLDAENVRTRNSSTSISVSDDVVPNEIMLRHKLKEEAISELDKYIDQAIVAKLGRVRIIHGKHGGVLRNAVHEYLSSHPFVKKYHIADYSEGGLGVTIAILEKK